MAQFLLGKEKKTGKVISIFEAPNGLSCNCVCPECDKDFMAVQGEKKEWHFRHSIESSCSGGQETALHKMAKQILSENSLIQLPLYGQLLYTDPRTEKYVGKIRPDVIVKLDDDSDLCIEILVKHPVGVEKELVYTNGCHRSIEIDLKDYLFTTNEELEKEVLFSTSNKRIIFWEKEIVEQISTSVEDSKDNYDWLKAIGVASLAIGIYQYFKSPKKNRY